MAEEIIKVEIIRREIIKPSSPTPPHLKSFKLSLLDQLQSFVYVPFLIFYPKSNSTSDSDQRSQLQQLKKSLSESLGRFYPIAGRVNNNNSIECSDEGASFVEARINGHDQSTFLDQPANRTVLQQFLPPAPEPAEWPLLHVQATFFDCGGMAIGVYISHKLADATTLAIFMKSWAETSSGSGRTINPVLNAAAYFPPRDILTGKQPGSATVELKKAEGVSKRFVFDKSKILDLKAKTGADSGGVQQPTRVEAVTALIWKSVMAASSRVSNSEGTMKKFALTQAINIRKRVDPPMPENLVGNIVGCSVSETNHQNEGLRELVGLLRKGIREFSVHKAKRLGGGDEASSEVIVENYREVGELFRREDTNVLVLSSFCNFGWYEGVDFGWGKPIWVTSPSAGGYTDVVKLMDTRGGNGVEAWITLNEQVMAFFERDSELLQFACPSAKSSRL